MSRIPKPSTVEEAIDILAQRVTEADPNQPGASAVPPAAAPPSSAAPAATPTAQQAQPQQQTKPAAPAAQAQPTTEQFNRVKTYAERAGQYVEAVKTALSKGPADEAAKKNVDTLVSVFQGGLKAAQALQRFMRTGK